MVNNHTATDENVTHTEQGNPFSALKEISKTFSAYESITEKISDNLFIAMQNASKNITLLLDSIKIPIGDDNHNIAIKEAYDEWGKLGWTEFPFDKTKIISNHPVSKHDADRLAVEYFNDSRTVTFLSLVLEVSMDNEDVNSAIFCFKHQQYKACALLLFSLIDYSFSIFQESHTNNIGCSGAKKASTAYKSMLKDSSFIKYILRYSGLFKALFAFYGNTDNFNSEETDTINRHFISHGYSSRAVTKYDCIKLFLAYYNLLNLAEFYDIYKRRSLSTHAE